MDTWTRLTDLRREASGGDQKRLAKEHICIAHGHRQQCGEGWWGAGWRGAKGEIQGTSVIILKTHREAEQITKQNSYIYCLQETHFRLKDRQQLKIKRWKKMFHENGNKIKSGAAILIPDKTDSK